MNLPAVGRLLRGPGAALVGTGVLGLSGYGFLTVTTGKVSLADYSALAALYLLVAIIGPAVCMALEQETTRVVTAWRAQGQGTADALRQLIRSASVAAAVIGVMLAALAPLLISRVFQGHVGLWWALLGSVLGFVGVGVPRGVLAAQRRLTAYGLVIGVDGLVRLVPCLALAAAGVTDPVPYGLALGVGPLVSFATGAALIRLGEPGPRLVWRSFGSGASSLTVAWAASLTLTNIAPVLVTGMISDSDRAATFSFASVIVRLPLFVLFAVQPVLLPVLTRAVANHDMPGLRRGIRQAMVLVGGFALLVLVAAAPLGHWLIRALFADAPVPSAAVLTLLAAGTVFAMLVQVLQPALLAVASHRMVAVAWLAGVVVFAAGFALPGDALIVATLAQLAAAATTAVIMGVTLARGLGSTGDAAVAAARPSTSVAD